MHPITILHILFGLAGNLFPCIYTSIRPQSASVLRATSVGENRILQSARERGQIFDCARWSRSDFLRFRKNIGGLSIPKR